MRARSRPEAAPHKAHGHISNSVGSARLTAWLAVAPDALEALYDGLARRAWAQAQAANKTARKRGSV